MVKVGKHLTRHLSKYNPAPVYACGCVLCNRTAEAILGIWDQQLLSVWRVAQSQAGNIGAAALALILAVGLCGAIFTIGGWRPMLEIAPDSQIEQSIIMQHDPIVIEARQMVLTPGEIFAQQGNPKARTQQPVAICAPRGRLGRQSLRGGQQFNLSALLRMLRHPKHLVISKLLGNDGDFGQ